MAFYNSDKYPSGKMVSVRRGWFAVRGYGDYEVVDYSKDTLMPTKATDNFELIQPFLLRFGRRRYYIGSVPQEGERVTKLVGKDETTGEPVVKEVGEKYTYLPVYSSLYFGSQCIARLYAVADTANLWIGTIGGYTVKFKSDEFHEYTKKDGEVIQYLVAEISKAYRG